MPLTYSARTCACLAVLVFATSCTDSPPPARRAMARAIDDHPDSGSSKTAITNVTVINPDVLTPQRNMTVVVRDGRIAAVGPASAIAVPADALHIDGTARFLIPGLWDSHAHVAYPGECALQRMIAHGVTSVRDLGGPPADGLRWRREIAEGKRIGPRLYLAGLNVESAEWLDGVERMLATAPPDLDRAQVFAESPRFKVGGRGHARAAADTATKLGMDVIKFRNLGGADFRTLARRARSLGVPLAGHSPGDITLADAAEAGLKSVEHVSNLSDVAELPAHERADQYARIARSGMFVSPTLVSDGMWAPDSLVQAVIALRRQELSPGQVRMWQSMVRDRRMWSKPTPRRVHDSVFTVKASWVQEAHRAGVPILAGTDLGTLLTFPGASLHEELALLVEKVGLTPLEALRTATVNPPKYFGLEQELGTIAPGKRADLVLLADDPLRDIRNVARIDAVVAAGRYYSPADIMQFKAVCPLTRSIDDAGRSSTRHP